METIVLGVFHKMQHSQKIHQKPGHTDFFALNVFRRISNRIDPLKVPLQ